jgi:predicted nucleic acid-binding protein
VRVFLDASVIIWALERADSNSALLFQMALEGRIEAIVDEQVLAEVARFLRIRRGRSFAWLFTEQIRRVAKVVQAEECRGEMDELKTSIKRKDLIHAAAAKRARVTFLIALDDDFASIPEYRTPKQAVEALGLPPKVTDW